ncbi:MAG: site-2 protease family protein [Flavobacteriales bacterium]
MEDQGPTSWYEAKPQLEKVKVKGNWGLTAFSVILFVLSFLYVFSDQLDFVFYLVLVLLIHEFGHFLLMKRFRYQDLRMLFIPLMGAFVQGSKMKYSQKESFLVIAAGPIPGVIIGLICLHFSVLNQAAWLLELSFLFLFLNVLNLLPIDPLDGGQLFKLFVKQKRDLFLLIFSLLSSLLMMFVGFRLESWILFGFGLLMSFKVRSFQRNYHLRQYLDELELNYELNYEDLSDFEYSQLKRALLDQQPRLAQLAQLHGDDANDLIAAHVNSVLLAPLQRDASTSLKVGIIIFWLLSLLLPVFLLFGKTYDFTWYFEKL